jgi:RNA polymerase sigma-54 factor
MGDLDVSDEQDWSDSQVTGPSDTPWSGDGEHSQDFSAAGGETLQEHLTWQLEMSRLSEREMRIGAAIIDAINDDGYVIESLDEIARNLQPEIVATAAEVERVLAHVQAMDPAGVGARSVSECIELQLRQLDSQTPGRDTALIIAANYLDQVADQQYALLRRQLRVTEEEMEHALVLVRACQPRPGSSVHSVPAEYIVPDVFVRRTERGWAVDINPGQPAAHPRQPELRRTHRPLRRSRDVAHAAAGSALADSQPGNPQRDAAESRSAASCSGSRPSSSTATSTCSR